MPERFLSSEEYDEQAHLLYNNGDYEGALQMLKEMRTENKRLNWEKSSI